MKLNKFLKLSLGIFFALPASIIFGNEMLANNISENNYEIQNDELLACGGGGGGGGGGSSPAAGRQKLKAKAKLNLRKTNLKMAAAGESLALCKLK